MRAFSSRLRTAAVMLTLVAFVAACSQPASPSATADASKSASATEKAATLPSKNPAPSESAAASEEPADEGIALADTSLELLKAAYEGQGYTFGELVTEGDVSYFSGYDDATDEVQVVLSGPTPAEGEEMDLTQVAVYDYSAGEEGPFIMGFSIGIFAPEAEAWLVEQIEAAMAAPGEPLEASMQFDFVTLTVNAFTDDAQSIDLRIN
jgi:hypothetical protein